MKGLVVILGYANDDSGNLLEISKDRLDLGKEYQSCTNYKILLTGGFGEHFNRTDKPYALYAKNYLLKKGIEEKEILEFVESNNTLEDALFSKPIAEKYGVKTLIIVTSNFHMKRVSYIFERVFAGYNLFFSSSKTTVSAEKMKILDEHEQIELAKLRL